MLKKQLRSLPKKIIIKRAWRNMLQNMFVFKEDKNAEHRVWWKTLLKTYTAYAIIVSFVNESRQKKYIRLFFKENLMEK